MAQSYNSFAKAFESALGNVSRAQDAALKREALKTQTEIAEFGLDTNKANRAISFLDSIDGFMDFKIGSGTYELGENYLEAFQKMDPNTRQYLLNANTSINQYINTNVRDGSGIERGEVGGPIVINKNKQGKPLVPTSLTDRRAEAEASGNADALAAVDKDINDWISSGKSVVMVPLKRKDGKFSFFTRNRTDREDDNTLLLSGAEFGSLLQGRINQLYTAINPTMSRKAQAFSQPDIQEALGTVGTGTDGVTTDTVMDEIRITGQQAYNAIDNPNSQIRGADQSEGLQSAIALMQKGISADKLAKWNDYKAAGTTQTSSIEGVSDADLLKGLQPGGQYDFFNLSADEQREVLTRLGANALGGRIGVDQKAQDSLLASGNVPLRRYTDTVNVKQGKRTRPQSTTVIELERQAPQTITQGGVTYTAAPGSTNLTQQQFMDGIDMSQYPDLSKITTKKAALDLVNSGNLQSFMSDELIASYKIALQNAGVNSGESFNQAVEDKKVQNPFLASLVVASALAGPETTESDVRSLATSLVNNIKTGDPSVDSGELVQAARQNIDTRQAFLNYRKELSDDAREAQDEALDNLVTALDEAIDDPSDAEGGASSAYRIARTEIDAFLNDIPDNYDKLGILKNSTGKRQRVFQKVKTLVSESAYNKLKQNSNFFTADFWGDIAAPENSDDFANAFENMAWRVKADGTPIELVTVESFGGQLTEAEESLSAQQLQNAVGPTDYAILLRVIPVLNPQ